MRLHRKLGGCLIAAVMMVGLAPPIAAAANPSMPATPATAGQPATAGKATAGEVGADAAKGGTRAVTLITGDRVTVRTDGTNRAAVTAGKGRQKVTFTTRTIGGHLHVIPSDAMPLLNAGRLDPRLFDVTTLLAFGYDNTRSTLPLIVTYNAGAAAKNKVAARSKVATAGATVVRELPAVNGLAVKQDRKEAEAFWAGLTTRPSGARTKALADPVKMVWLDGVRQTTLDQSVPQIGAPAAWQAGFDGAGVPVAVVDTGIDASHPDLAGKVIAAQNFTEDGSPLDTVGHGTHVASTIAGSGAASNGRYKGVSPGSKLYDAKVCVAYGCQESWIVAGMQWAAAEQRAKVVNMSLGGSDGPGLDPLEEAVQTLTEQYGTLFVIASGNSGRFDLVSSPASADHALAVGAVTKTDALADFSSRGPRRGDSALKPDITAPGVDIVAANSKDGFLGRKGESYTTLSGTSMATPHVVGAAAILAQQHPGWSPARLKATLMASAKPNPALTAYEQGAGRVDVARAIAQTVITSPPSVSFGVQLWPHHDDVPTTKTVTYQNAGTAAVSLNLALRAAGPDGKPAPADLFSLSASTVTVPAGGEASVSITADTRAASADGFAGGELVATAGDTVVRTPFAVDKEVESYDISLVHLDRTGAPTPDYGDILINTEKFGIYSAYDASGTAKVRLPKGKYLLHSLIFKDDEQDPEVSQLADPGFVVDRTRTITLDARQAKPVSVTLTGAADVTQVLADVSFTFETPELTLLGGLVGETFKGLFSAQIGDAGKVAGLTSGVGAQWGRRTAAGSLHNSPVAYHAAWFEEGRITSGFDRTIAQREMAAVRADLAAEATNEQGEKAAFGAPLNSFAGGWATLFSYDLPTSRTEYYNTDGVRWSSSMHQTMPSTDPEDPFPTLLSGLYSEFTQYRAGRPYHETWNQAVLGPVFPARPIPELWATRTGNEMVVAVPLFGDQAGREGHSALDSARLAVSRDGTTVFEGQQPGALFPVPAEAGRYRVELEATRGAPFDLSTSTKVAWTFRSGPTAGTTPVPLPMSVIRFMPKVNLENTVPDGREIVIPIEVQRQPDSKAGALRSLKVEVSFDDGKTWQPTSVSRKQYGGVVKLKHPKGHGVISLRAGATDSANNTVEQTIIRAFRY